jgi:hypothetical protein
LNRLKIIQVVNEANAVLPRYLINFAVQNRHSFGENIFVHIVILQNLSALQLDFSERGFAVLSGAFIQKSVLENQALRKSFRIVFESVNNFVSVNRRFIRRLIWRGDSFVRVDGRIVVHAQTVRRRAGFA